MKAIQKFIVFLPVFLLLSALLNMIMAQDTATGKKKDNVVQEKIDSKNFVFVARSVTPQRGSFRQLTTTYDVKVTKDSVISDLPYFGRAYSAPIDPSAGGIKFTSTSFDYSVHPRKKGGWDIAIKPNDTREVQQLFFNIFENGSASLNVTSNNRQPISFSGVVK